MRTLLSKVILVAVLTSFAVATPAIAEEGQQQASPEVSSSQVKPPPNDLVGQLTLP